MPPKYLPICTIVLAMFLAHGDCSYDFSGGDSTPKRQGRLSVLLVTADVPGHPYSLLALAETLAGRGHNVSMMTVGMEETNCRRCALGEELSCIRTES